MQESGDSLCRTPGSNWKRSSRCITGFCVEVSTAPGSSSLRDSKQADLGPQQPIITLTSDQFDTFQDELLGLADEGANGELAIDRLAGGLVAFRSLTTGVVLTFDSDELVAFIAGVRTGEFRPLPSPVG